MSIDKVQLKQEELVGDQVVLTDINPITDTVSVMDGTTGSTLQETLDRIYNLINNKLARVVNSVNDKTGAVVLTSDDVGLGNVDNVSFADIKAWVLDQLTKAFRNKQLHLYTYLTEATIAKNTNDQSLDGAPFYAEYGDTSDKRGYIGYFYWDDVSNQLEYDYRPIRTIGGTDGSIRYTDTGDISVKIHPDEEALSNVDTGNIETSGLKIDGSKIVGKMIFADCLYGDGTQSINTSDPTAMLATINTWKGDPIEIYINGTQIDNTTGTMTPHYLNTAWDHQLKVGDIIVTSFRPRVDLATSTTYAKIDLMGQQPAIGIIEAVPDDLNTNYVLKFYTIKTYIGGDDVGCGLKYYDSHVDDNHSYYNSKQLGIGLGEEKMYSVGVDTDENFSGLQGIFSTRPSPTDPTAWIPSDRDVQVQTPWGFKAVRNGMCIQTDPSLAICPWELGRPSGDSYKNTSTTRPNSNYLYFGSKMAANWSLEHIEGGGIDPRSTAIPDRHRHDGPTYGYASTTSYLSIKLEKLKTFFSGHSTTQEDVADGPFKSFINVSGMRIENDFDLYAVSYDMSKLGITDGMDAVGNVVPDLGNVAASGGCMVNVGKFLEICPTITEKAENYFDSGKVQVRIGKGLKEQINYSEPITTKPDDWETNFKNYRITNGTSYSPVPSGFLALNDDPGDDWAKTYFYYYTRSGEDPNYVYTPVPRVYDAANIPTWEADTFYYEKPHDFDSIIDTSDVVKYLPANRIVIDEDIVGVQPYVTGRTYTKNQLISVQDTVEIEPGTPITRYRLFMVVVDSFEATSVDSDKTNGKIVQFGTSTLEAILTAHETAIATLIERTGIKTYEQGTTFYKNQILVYTNTSDTYMFLVIADSFTADTPSTDVDDDYIIEIFSSAS